MKRDQSIKARLEEAWKVSAFSGDAYVAATHDFVVHWAGGDCDGGTRCPAPDRENLAMLDCAISLREASPHGDLEDLKRLWAARMTVS